MTGRSAPERTQPRRAHTPAPERDERPSFPPALPGGEDLFEELERMPVAILLVGSGNALVFANRQARLLLERGEALCLDGQRLRCTDRESDVRLFRAVEVCVQAARDGEEHRLAVDLISPRQRLEAAVSASARGDGRRPAAVVMVRAARAR